MLYAAVLLSRQSRRPCGNDPWVRQTVGAVQWLVEHGFGIISSVGVPTWELITAAAVDHAAHLRVIVPAASAEKCSEIKAAVEHDFELSSDTTEFTCITDSDKRQNEHDRDEQIVRSADLLIPISVRTGGSMQALIESASAKGRAVNHEFIVPYDTRRERLAYTVDPLTISSDLARVEREYLVHWTRTGNGPWPGERRIEYYRALVGSGRYPRTAFDTLKQIVSSRRIIASPRHMAGRTPTVSLTGLAPREVIPLMRWRARFGEMSFEPYGLGLRREIAESVGIRPVIYHENSDEETDATEKWLTQSTGTRTDWRQECEYRHLGDLDFSRIPNNQLIAFCREPLQADEISSCFGVNAISFEQA